MILRAGAPSASRTKVSLASAAASIVALYGSANRSMRAFPSSTDFGRERLVRQRQQIERLAAGIGVPLVALPRLATPRLTLHQLGELADALVGPLIGEAS